MNTAIFILIILACLLLALIILIQNPKGGGLDSSFGSASQLGGVQKTTDFLEKATWGLAIFIVVLSLVASMNTGSGDGVTGGDETYRDELPQAPVQE
ncbi:preprotein translocase subunit SecG [Luteibaculum oceani]|uniref:Protein-export membrane protein SecG n=1 Tax=Luteibaculum oceani TaxID=1294296 RepID=A0A5C6V227_9FLAO|nr:preprotein translocase subunit SecG [Luteibaculum oceani]TXC78860.1 preprotein translocase subunit SecG [Luteibaculum oceani]